MCENRWMLEHLEYQSRHAEGISATGGTGSGTRAVPIGLRMARGSCACGGAWLARAGPKQVLGRPGQAPNDVAN